MYRYLISLMLIFMVMLGVFGCGKKQEETMGATLDSTTVPVVATQSAEETATEAVGSPLYNEVDLDENGEVLGAEGSVIETVPQETKPTETTESVDTTEETEENTSPTAATEPAETTEPTVPQETKPVVIPGATQELTEYEKYNAMSGEEQMAYMQSYDTIEAFFVWYNNAKAEYEALHPEIEIGDGIIDAGDLVG